MGFFRIFNPNLPKPPLYLRNRLFRRRTTTRSFSSEIRLFTSQKTPLPRQKAAHFLPAIHRYVAGIRCTPSGRLRLRPKPYPNPNPSPSAKSTGLQVGHLPEELSKNVVFLECESTAESGTCHVYLVGTVHVSEESCREVQAVIRYLKPQVVFLELCLGRVALLTSPQNLQVPTMSEMIDRWKKTKMNPFGILLSWFLAKVAVKLKVLPVSEFRVAYEEARSYGAKVVLGDRPLQITLRRTWGKMSLWHEAKFLFSILFHAILLPRPERLKKMLNKMLREMDDVDRVTPMIQEMSRVFPTLMETLLYERDLYMSSTLLKVASEHSSVVAVVGKGHLQGIKKHWKQPIELKGLLDVPVASSGVSAIKILASVGVAVTGVAIISVQGRTGILIYASSLHFPKYWIQAKYQADTNKLTVVIGQTSQGETWHHLEFASGKICLLIIST